MILFNRSRILKLCVINVLTNRLIFSDVIVCIIFPGGGGGVGGRGVLPYIVHTRYVPLERVWFSSHLVWYRVQ